MDDDAYNWGDPKNYAYVDSIIDRADNGGDE